MKKIKKGEKVKKTSKQIITERYNRFVTRKAEAINKLLSDKKVADVKLEDRTYTVTYKNGQVFRFTFYPDSRFYDRRIVPILKEEN